MVQIFAPAAAGTEKGQPYLSAVGVTAQCQREWRQHIFVIERDNRIRRMGKQYIAAVSLRQFRKPRFAVADIIHSGKTEAAVGKGFVA